MKNKFMITISDVHGIRQFTLDQFIKVIAKWIIMFIVLMFVIGVIYLKVLSNQASSAKEETKHAQEQIIINEKESQKAQEKAQERILSLEQKQQTLQNNIQTKIQELESMNGHLADIEDLLGLERDDNVSLENRTDVIRNVATKKIEKEKLSLELVKVLNRSVPNGKPLSYKYISSGFGYRKHPITHKRAFHAGLDFSAPTGTPIRATADGIVTYAKDKKGYGKFILIYHPFGFKTAYGHLSKYKAKVGDYVQKGDVIGFVGNTGRSTGPHLHYEIFYLHKWIDPTRFLGWNKDNYIDIMNHEPKVNWEKLTTHINKQLTNK